VSPEVDDEAEVLARRAAAMLPGELLQPSEIIVLLLKPSPLFILLAPLRALVGLVLLTLGVALANRYLMLGLPQRDVLLAGVAAVGLVLFWHFLEWLSRVYVLTDRRVIRVQGVLRVGVFECALERIQHTETFFSIRERLFGLGSIGFATAGSGFVEAAWEMVAQPLEVHHVVVRTIRRYGKRGW
jgi:uncharacterized membrane protein YdbT with pleckstrin-like domain